MDRSDFFVEQCDCQGELLKVDKWTDRDSDGKLIDTLYFMSFWQLGNDSGKLSFRDRLIYLWKILIDGEPHPDMLVFRESQMERIHEKIGELIDSKNS
jgi:hypothetical protein